MKTTTAEILQLVQDSTNKNLVPGSDYNNRNNIKNRKNRNNSLTSFSEDFVDGIATGSPKDYIEDLEDTEEEIVSAEPQTFTDMIMRAPIHFWDNGENARSRYKLTVRFNLDNKTNPSFIATLSKNLASFKKHIPEESFEEVTAWALGYRDECMAQGIKPYMGKFQTQKKQMDGPNKNKTRVEPFTAAVVWYNKAAGFWAGAIKFYDFEYEFALQDDRLSVKQRTNNCKSYDLYTKPELIKSIAGQTWAEKSGFVYKGKK